MLCVKFRGKTLCECVLTLQGRVPVTQCCLGPGWLWAHPGPGSHSSDRRSLPERDGWSGMPTPRPTFGNKCIKIKTGINESNNNQKLFVYLLTGTAAPSHIRSGVSFHHNYPVVVNPPLQSSWCVFIHVRPDLYVLDIWRGVKRRLDTEMEEWTRTMHVEIKDYTLKWNTPWPL